MGKRLFLWALPFALAVFAQPACAFLDPPYLTPANPVAGELVSVNVYGGECDVADTGVIWPAPVTQQGNAITILLTGIHEGDPEFCYFSIATETKPVGRFPPGNYTLDVERRYGTPFGEWAQETLGILPFTFAAVPQQSVETPTLGGVGSTVLLVVLLGAGWRVLRKRSA
jgi:hypothetical protein